MKPLVDKKYKLERFPGKGGWTYACIPQLLQDKTKPFGWVKVKGTIDGYTIEKCSLMPMGKGKLFLPVKAEIRKAIKKKEGDYVHVILYPDKDPLKVPEEMMLCLQDEPEALAFFNALSESERRYYVNYIYAARKIDTRVDRMTKTINKLLRGLKPHQREPE